MNPKSTFRIGEVNIEGDVMLAPMDGITDLPFRVITRRLGSALSTSGFINALDVINRHPLLFKRTAFADEERPFACQLYDDNPDRLLQAGIWLERENPDLIDINLGCPARSVAGRGAGAALMREPNKVARIFSSLSKAVKIPITAKMRLGWSQHSKNYLEIAKIIEDNGGQCIAVHARTKDQVYAGPVDWDAVAQIKQAVSIPIIGNGQVCNVSDIDRVKNHTGCDAVMIGRGAIENPWIFSRRERTTITAEEVLQTMQDHFKLMVEFHGSDSGLAQFRKFIKGYLQPYNLNRHQSGIILSTTSEVVLWDQVRKVVFSKSLKSDNQVPKD